MSNEHISSREFGALEQQVKNLDDKVTTLETDVKALRSDMAELLALANKGKGAWWAALTASSVIGALMSWFGHSIFTR
jgi:phage shock protein A